MSFGVMSSWLRCSGEPGRVALRQRGLRLSRPFWRLIAVLLPLFLLCALPGVAGAADLAPLPAPVAGAGETPEAPMCDPTGASVGVRAEVAEVDRGRFEEAPCEDSGSFMRWALGGEQHDGRAVSSRGVPSQPLRLDLDRGHADAIFSVVLALPRREQPDLAASPFDVGLGPSRGHRLAVFRPPLIAA
jgi:hypothetical protein